ncbi:MAG TPA: HlyD family secretion protein, partial [Acetobacteraceae bacterium]|nr:HlyD family secretion protein [Acetobacteraceae bacterium]
PPWTRDATVRAYVVTVTPQVSGLVIDLPVHADQFVRKGELLMQIEPIDFTLAVTNAEAALEGARADLANRRAEANRRAQLTTLSTSVEEQQRFASQADAAAATVKSDLANLARARVALARTRIVAPVSGKITNLQIQEGDYATSGQRALSVVDTGSFWVDGYFEETQLARIHLGDSARVTLMGFGQPLEGHVAGIASGIEVANAQSGQSGLASVNPVYTWIRLAQRVPVRIEIDHLPPGVLLVAGQTATVQIQPGTAPATNK